MLTKNRYTAVSYETSTLLISSDIQLWRAFFPRAFFIRFSNWFRSF